MAYANSDTPAIRTQASSTWGELAWGPRRPAGLACGGYRSTIDATGVVAPVDQWNSGAVRRMRSVTVEIRGIGALRRFEPPPRVAQFFYGVTPIYSGRNLVPESPKLHAFGPNLYINTTSNHQNRPEGSPMTTYWLQRLVAIAPPPLASAQVDWLETVKHIGVDLPSDYTDLADAYGCAGIDAFLWLLAPSDNPNLDLARLVTRNRSYLEVPGLLPPPGEVAPQFPWAITDNGDICWIATTTGSGSGVLVEQSRRAGWEFFEMGIAEFLAKALLREIQPEAFPDDFPSDGPPFPVVRSSA